MVRLAAIPYADGGDEYTPFQCVERVKSVRLLESIPANGWLPAHVEFDISGIGSWSQDIRLAVPPWPFNPFPPPATCLELGEVQVIDEEPHS